MLVAPDGAGWARIPSWAWHRAGSRSGRARTIITLARRAEALESLPARTPEEASVAMRSLPGIGVWTAAEVAVRALGDADAVSFGDFHLARTIVHLLTGRTDGTDEQLAELLTPWAGSACPGGPAAPSCTAARRCPGARRARRSPTTAAGSAPSRSAVRGEADRRLAECDPRPDPGPGMSSLPGPIIARSPTTTPSSDAPAPMTAPAPTTLSRTTAPAATTASSKSTDPNTCACGPDRGARPHDRAAAQLGVP